MLVSDITKTKHGYPGGIASSSYQILINGTTGGTWRR